MLSKGQFKWLPVSAIILCSYLLANPGSVSAGIAGNYADIGYHWAASELLPLLELGVAQGYEDNTFRPDRSISRAEFLIMLDNCFYLKGQSQIEFSDVRSEDWFFLVIQRAGAAGIIYGYPDGSFKPHHPVSRQQGALILARLLAPQQKSSISLRNFFTDSEKIAPEAREAIATLVSLGLIRGYPDQTLQPQGYITRAEALVTLGRLLRDELTFRESVEIQPHLAVLNSPEELAALAGFYQSLWSGNDSLSDSDYHGEGESEEEDPMAIIISNHLQAQVRVREQ